MRGLPYLNVRIRDFTAKLGRRSGLRVVQWTRDARRRTSNIIIGFTGLNKNVGRNDGIVKPYWRPPTYLNAEICDFTAKLGRGSGLKVGDAGYGAPKITIGLTGLNKNARRDAGLNWGPFSWILTFLLNVRIVFYMFGLLVCSSFVRIDKLLSRPLTVVIYNVSIVPCDIFTVVALIYDI